MYDLSYFFFRRGQGLQMEKTTASWASEISSSFLNSLTIFIHFYVDNLEKYTFDQIYL